MVSIETRAEFQSRVFGDDGYGNEQGAWGPTQFARWCKVTPMRGGETVMASRLEGRQPAIISVPLDPETSAITPSMRCIIGGRAYNIREYPRPSDVPMWLDMLAEGGVADG